MFEFVPYYESFGGNWMVDNGIDRHQARRIGKVIP
jgi:hypothetical protein